MKLLLDTHSLIWWMLEDRRLSRPAYAAVADSRNRVFISAVSLCEIAIKISLKKLSVPDGFEREVDQMITSPPFLPLALTLEHAFCIRTLPWHHRDPFDRLLIAQSIREQLTLVTNDSMIVRYDVECLW